MTLEPPATAAQVSRQVLDGVHLRKLIDIIERVLLELSSGKGAQDGGETHVRHRQGDLLSYSGVVSFLGAAGGKILTASDGNPRAGLPYINAVTVVCELRTGTPLGVLDGGLLTAVRTACASAVATRLCLSERSHTHGVVGYGLQAETHLLAMREIGLREHFVTGRDLDRAQAFAERMKEEHALAVEVAASVKELCAACRVVTTVTAARKPLLRSGQLEPEQHLNVIGRFEPGWLEVAPELMNEAYVLVDSMDKYRASWRRQRMPGRHVHEIGSLLAGDVAGPSMTEGPTVFKPLGMGVFDVAAAKYVVDHELVEGG